MLVHGLRQPALPTSAVRGPRGTQGQTGRCAVKDYTDQSGFPLDLKNLEKMSAHLENLEISESFEKINKYHGKMT